jgi:hypothetical protein
MEFTDEQQEYIDKLVGQARQEGRKSGSEKAKQELRKELEQSEEFKRLARERAERIEELEPLAEKVERYQGVISGLLESRLGELGDKAKNAVEALPDVMTALDKLNWLTENADLFGGEKAHGTPKKQSRKQGRAIKPNKKRQVSL